MYRYQKMNGSVLKKNMYYKNMFCFLKKIENMIHVSKIENMERVSKNMDFFKTWIFLRKIMWILIHQNMFWCGSTWIDPC